MEITRDYLIEVRRRLENDQNAISGAIQMVDRLLAEVGQEEPKPVEPPVEPKPKK